MRFPLLIRNTLVLSDTSCAYLVTGKLRTPGSISRAKAQSRKENLRNAAALCVFAREIRCNRALPRGVLVFGKLPWSQSRTLRSKEIVMNKGRFKTLAIATLSAIALAASIAVAQTVTTNPSTQQGTE